MADYAFPATLKLHILRNFSSPHNDPRSNAFLGASKRLSAARPIAVPANRCRSIGARCERMDDGFYMRRCVEVARRAIGCTSPNPMVGCVIVDEQGEIVGEGCHPMAGQPHAEVFALKDAGFKAENATAYVSLEPCNHYGRTPPCTEALIRARVRHVVVGMVDPNPIVSSKGIVRLRESGIDVTVGVEQELCHKLNEAYIHRMVTGKPFLTLRYTLSLNGKMLNRLPEGSTEEGGCYSKLLQEYDGVVLASNLLGELDTLPSSNEAGAKQPFCVVLETQPSSLLRRHCPDHDLGGDISRMAIISMVQNTVLDVTRFTGFETAIFHELSSASVVEYLSGKGLCSVMVDLRGESDGVLAEIVAGALESGLVNKVVVEIEPGWDQEKELVMPELIKRSLRLKDTTTSVLNNNIVVGGYVQNEQ